MLKIRTVAALIISLIAATQTLQAADAQWRTDVGPAYQEALKKSQPLVILFTSANCHYCQELKRNVIDAGTLKPLAGQAIFVLADTQRDDKFRNVATMQSSLRIARFPTLVVLMPANKKLEDKGHMEGYDSPANYLSRLKALLPKPATAAKPAAAPAK